MTLNFSSNAISGKDFFDDTKHSVYRYYLKNLSLIFKQQKHNVVFTLKTIAKRVLQASVVDKANTTLKAFTLAEVLIVLGIIGLVADMTLPTLISSTQKKVAETSIRKFYSAMSQAIKLSEIENGSHLYWNQADRGTSDGPYNWFNTYLSDYLVHYSIEKTPNNYGDASAGALVKFKDGSQVSLNMGGCVDFNLDINGEKKPNKMGKDRFGFILCQTKAACLINSLELTGYWCSGTTQLPTTREELLQICKSNARYCIPLIEYDGWTIKDDYPWL